MYMGERERERRSSSLDRTPAGLEKDEVCSNLASEDVKQRQLGCHDRRLTESWLLLADEQRFGTSIDALLELNADISANSIVVGQSLCIVPSSCELE